MTTKEFVSYALNLQQIEYHSYDPNAKYQCVDLANLFIDKVWNLKPIIGTNAKDFPENLNPEMEFIKNTSALIAQEGWLAVWNGRVGGKAGHIAAVTRNGTINQFTSIDQNWSKPLFVTEETHTYANVRGFIKKVSGTTGTMPEKTRTEAEWQQERDERNKNWDLYQSQKQETEQYKTIAETRKTEFEQYRIEVNQKLDLPLSSDPADTYGAIERLLEREDQYIKAEKKIMQMEKAHELEKSEMLTEIENMRHQLEGFSRRVDELEARLRVSESTNKLYEWIKSIFNRREV